jgi:hypothetical protein
LSGRLVSDLHARDRCSPQGSGGGRIHLKPVEPDLDCPGSGRTHCGSNPEVVPGVEGDGFVRCEVGAAMFYPEAAVSVLSVEADQSVARSVDEP